MNTINVNPIIIIISYYSSAGLHVSVGYLCYVKGNGKQCGYNLKHRHVNS